MAAHRPREQGQPVRIGARLRSAGGWSDVIIRNISARGMMGDCDVPPACGDYVELRCGSYAIVARVAWAQDDRFGVRTQDVIELPSLIASSTGRTAAANDRPQAPRQTEQVVRRQTLLERAAASIRLARTLDFLAVALAGSALAVLAASTAEAASAQHLDAFTALSAGDPSD